MSGVEAIFKLVRGSAKVEILTGSCYGVPDNWVVRLTINNETAYLEVADALAIGEMIRTAGLFGVLEVQRKASE